jgi:hypothetical protein
MLTIDQNGYNSKRKTETCSYQFYNSALASLVTGLGGGGGGGGGGEGGVVVCGSFVISDERFQIEKGW